MNDGLENSVVDLCLTCLKEEWLKYVEIIYFQSFEWPIFKNSDLFQYDMHAFIVMDLIIYFQYLESEDFLYIPQFLPVLFLCKINTGMS